MLNGNIVEGTHMEGEWTIRFLGFFLILKFIIWDRDMGIVVLYLMAQSCWRE